MATSAGQVQSTISVVAKTNGVDKTATQIAKLQLATEKIRTQQAKTATQMARAVSIQNKDAASKAKTALQTQKLALQNEKLATSISKAKNQQSLLNKALDLSKFVALGYTLKNVANGFIDLIGNAADYTENLNLFQVVMGKSIDKANDFVNSMHDVLGLDTSKLMEYMGTFKGMANNMGILEDKAYEMSEGLTKLTYDLASFYNTSVDQAFQSLSSAITGQTKSIREQFKGIDVTQGTLQIDLDRLGIDKQVSDLSYAEKSILRYISILRQSSSAQGDFARTMVSPAQMMKQLTERVTTLARAFGSIFIPILQATLPYILALTSLLTKLFNAIAKFLGYETMEFDYSGLTTGLGAASDDLDAVGGSADSANKKVKEFKKQLQGFDVLNVITTPTDTSSKGAGGGGGAGGIDQALLDAIKNYDNRLDLASDKVKKLEEAIQSFLSKLDFEPLKKSLDNLWESMKLVGNFAWQGLKDFYNEFLVPISQWTIGEGLPRFINAIANGLAKIDWDNLNAKLKELWKALTPFAIHVGEGLLWFFEKVLVPLGVWTISDVLPVFLDMLTSALKILNNAIEKASPLLNWLWDNFLSKIASFTGGAIVGILEGVASALKLIAENKTASTVLMGVLTAITGLAAIKTVKSLAETAGGLSGIISKGAQSSKTLTILSGALKGTTLEFSEGANKATLFSKFLQNVGSVGKSVGKTLLTAGANVLTFGKNLLTGQVNAKNLSGTLSGSLKNAFSSVGNSMKTAGSNAKFAIDYYSQTASAATKLGVSLAGATGLVVALKATSNGMKEIAENGEATASSLGKVAGGMLTAAGSGAAIGAQFGLAGAAIGGVVGIISNLLISLDSIPSKYEKIANQIDKNIEKSKKYIKSINEERKELEKTLSTDLESITINQDLYKELMNIVDANGKIKEGYEERATFIVGQLNRAYGTEYKVVDGVIQKYDEFKLKIGDVINAQKAKAILNVKEQEYVNALSDQSKLLSQVEKDYKNLETANKNLSEAEQKVLDIQSTMNTTSVVDRKRLADAKEDVERLRGEVDKASTAYENSSKAYSQSVQDVKTYEDILVAYTEGRYDDIDKIMKESSDKSYTLFAESLIKETTELNGGALTKDLKTAWKALATSNYDTYAEKIADLPETTRQEIQKITGVYTEKTPEVTKAADKLGTDSVKAMKKDYETQKVANDTIVSYIQGLSKKEQKAILKKAGVENVDEVIKGLKKGDISDDVGQQLVKGLANGIKNDYWQGKAFSNATGLMNMIIKKMKDAGQIKSPSRKTRELGIFLLQGIGVGFDKEKAPVLNAAKNTMNNIIDTMSNATNSANPNIGIDFTDSVSDALDNLLANLNSFYSSYALVMDNLSTKTQTSLIEASNVATDINNNLGIIPNSGNYSNLFSTGNINNSGIDFSGSSLGNINNSQNSNSVASSLDRVMSKYMSRQQSVTAPIQVYVGGDKVEETTRKINIRNENVYGTGR